MSRSPTKASKASRDSQKSITPQPPSTRTGRVHDHPLGRVRVYLHYLVSRVVVLLRSSAAPEPYADSHCKPSSQSFRATLLHTGGRLGCAPNLTIHEEPLDRSEQGHPAARDSRKLLQSVGRLRATPATLELFDGNRAPELIDNASRLAGDLLDRALEMLGPEPQARLAGEFGVAADDIHLRVVEQRVFVEVCRPDREPGVVDDPDLGVHIQGAGEGAQTS